ncbi:COG4648 family protein [Acidithiobacillus sp.]
MRISRGKAVKLFSRNSPISRLTEFGGVAFSLLVFVAYQILTYLGTYSTNPGGLAVVSAFAPAIIILLFMSWNARYRIVGFSCIIAGCVALWHYRNILVPYLTWANMIQRSGIFALLTAVFGLTLLPGHIPMVSRIAELIHGSLSDRLLLYTRRVTMAWAIFFATMTGLPLIIFLFIPQQLWFLFTNIISAMLVALMFFAEYIVRCRAIPVGDRAGMIEGIHAYFKYSAKTATSKQQQDNSNPGPPQ